MRILLVEVYERIGKSVISVWKNVFMTVKKSIDRSDFVIVIHILKSDILTF